MGFFRKNPYKNYHNNHCESCGSLIHDLPYKGIIVFMEGNDLMKDKVLQMDYHYFPPCWDKTKIENAFRILAFYEARPMKEFTDKKYQKNSKDLLQHIENPRLRLSFDQKKCFIITKPEGVDQELYETVLRSQNYFLSPKY